MRKPPEPPQVTIQRLTEAINKQDLPVIMGVVLIGAVFLVIANIVVDVLYAVIDPRVRYT